MEDDDHPLSNGSDIDYDDPDMELESGVVLTRLSEPVRKQYFRFLEKLLSENYEKCKTVNQVQENRYILACAELLEDKALKSCMMVQIYRKSMVKIIANVRRSTEQCRLQHHLRILLEEKPPDERKLCLSKSTQTDSVLKRDVGLNSHPEEHVDDEFVSPSLQRKMEMFKKKINSEIAETIVSKRTKLKKSLPSKGKRLKSNISNTSLYEHDAAHQRPLIERVFPQPSPQSITITPSPLISENKKKYDHDIVAQELAQLFSEEKNEIDEIFGFGNEPDDPQINSILMEIQNAKLPKEQKSATIVDNRKQFAEEMHADCATYENGGIVTEECRQSRDDLRYSLWPCELYMQTRKLSDTLSRLIEEDFRWHDIMKWKFVILFGEDSDDEFASCSPSIELDEVLMCSCIKRISPWVVKHLMKPMNDGLIANRFLFKKLAKKLSRLIIMENQYPEEKIIKTVVENFFCIRQAVLSVEDLELPFTISTNEKLFSD